MSLIAQVFAKKRAYVAYLMAGDQGCDYSLMAMQALTAGGVNILELGVPFSDPVADGPVIQAAAMRALKQNTKLDNIFKTITEFRKTNATPIILFSYYNPLLQYGLEKLIKKAKSAGVNGILIVDLPIEEMAEYHQLCEQYGIDPILLISPSTPLKRIKAIAKLASGMLYYVCRQGTTGVREQMPADLAECLALIKSCTKLPVVVGFGIASKQMAKAAIEHADGFVIGSRFVKAMADKISANKLTQLTKTLDPRGDQVRDL
ncbi:MAG: tryptophan synthase subunit alpha [Gammaproteobacteria bacterium]|nr:tryptophan synthase subunit alpha [Gammaproteobacteria bacterium]